MWFFLNPSSPQLCSKKARTYDVAWLTMLCNQATGISPVQQSAASTPSTYPQDHLPFLATRNVYSATAIELPGFVSCSYLMARFRAASTDSIEVLR